MNIFNTKNIRGIGSIISNNPNPGTYIAQNFGLTNVSGNSRFASNVEISGNLAVAGSTNLDILTTNSISGNVLLLDTTQCENVETGSLKINGGVSIKKNVYIGGNLNVLGITNLTGNVISSTAQISTGLISTSDTTQSTVLGTGALQISGGASVNRNLFVGGLLNIAGNIKTNSTENSTSITSGALQSSGGLGIAGNCFLGGNVFISSNLFLGNTTVRIGTIITNNNNATPINCIVNATTVNNLTSINLTPGIWVITNKSKMDGIVRGFSQFSISTISTTIDFNNNVTNNHEYGFRSHEVQLSRILSISTDTTVYSTVILFHNDDSNQTRPCTSILSAVKIA